MLYNYNLINCYLYYTLLNGFCLHNFPFRIQYSNVLPILWDLLFTSHSNFLLSLRAVIQHIVFIMSASRYRCVIVSSILLTLCPTVVFCLRWLLFTFILLLIDLIPMLFFFDPGIRNISMYRCVSFLVP